MNVASDFILASGSPRRSFLLKACGFNFTVSPSDISEDYNPSLNANDVPGYLALLKAKASRTLHPKVKLILTADTVVILNDEILNKPKDESEAVDMLLRLSGNAHTVVTSTVLSTQDNFIKINCNSTVRFNKLEREDIVYYVRNFKPLDKAGAYGAQECLPEHYNPCSIEELNFLEELKIKYLLHESKKAPVHIQPIAAINSIEGSYFNVMGLPIHELFEPINRILNK